MKTPVVLLVDDEDSIINSLRGSMEDEGYIVLSASDGIKAMEIIKSHPVDMVFLDIWLPGTDGLTTLKTIKEFDSTIDVVMMTGHGTINTAVQAVKQGAFDFLEKPFSLDSVIDIAHKIKQTKLAAIKTDLSDGAKAQNMDLTGNTAAIREINALISKAVADSKHLLLQGESGSGKEHVAKLVHHRLKDPDKKGFLKINCSLFNPDDLAIELFGTAVSSKPSPGKQGAIKNPLYKTVFLDAVDLLPLKIQDRLADEITTMKDKSVKKKIVAATIKAVESEIASGRFSRKLFDSFQYRIVLPPLRERRSDIPLLIERFLNRFCADNGFKEKTVDDEAMEILVNYDWHGNIKELKNLVEKLAVSVSTSCISAGDIPVSFRDDINYNIALCYDRHNSMESAEASWRKHFILYHLRKNQRDISRTADQLNIKERTLQKYIREYNIIIPGKSKQAFNYQKTLKRSMVISGRGLHSGDKTGLILSPLPPNSGIIFGNISDNETVPAHIDFVESTSYATCLRNGTATARTIEHLLAVLHAYRITNLMVKINNEVPIMDGSASDFCRIIDDAGIEEQDEIIEEITVRKKYVLDSPDTNGKSITVEPSNLFSIHYTLDYPPPVGRQVYEFQMTSPEKFRDEIAPARTFGFVKDIEQLEKRGLAGGGRLNNFILIDDEKIVNTTLRFPEEFARHKILDMVGDLYLLGRPLKCRISAKMTGHSENIALVKMLTKKLNL